MSSPDPVEAQRQVEKIQKRLQSLQGTSYQLYSQVPMYLESRAGKLMQEMRENIYYACRDINYLLALLGYDEDVQFETEDRDLTIEPVYEKDEDEKTLLLACHEFRNKQQSALDEIIVRDYGQSAAEMKLLAQDISLGKVVLRVEQKPDELEVRYERSAEKV